MPYFIDIVNLEVVVRPPGATAGQGQAIVDRDTAAACDLAHGQKLTAEQAQALLDGSPSRFRALLAGGAPNSPHPNPSRALRQRLGSRPLQQQRPLQSRSVRQRPNAPIGPPRSWRASPGSC
jgi:hypothetical protein